MNYRRCRLPTTDVRGVSGIISLQHPSLPDFIAKRFIGLSEHRLLRCGGFPQIPIRHHSPWSTRPASPTPSPLHQPFIAHHGPLPSTKSKAIKHATRFGHFRRLPLCHAHSCLPSPPSFLLQPGSTVRQSLLQTTCGVMLWLPTAAHNANPSRNPLPRFFPSDPSPRLCTSNPLPYCLSTLCVTTPRWDHRQAITTQTTTGL